ncbi:MAG: acetylglutamate kinase [Alphaproteobacteria bacterium]|nr:acetylglutamate kinase [Alphaproteobacteria bacterium]HCP00578.1 acetylglutamate kinase [Rhodospirillaceae bacterium]
MAAAGKYWNAPSLADLEAIASEVFLAIPTTLSRYVANIAIHVEDFPDDETMATMDLESPFDILGLYVGVSLDQKSLSETPSDVDRIYLYRRPILDYWCETEEDLYHLVHHVLIHEIGHHFGFTDDDMKQIETSSH